MDAKAFQKALADAAPTPAQYVQVGLSLGEAQELIETFRLDVRSKVVPNTIPDQVLAELFSSFDPSRIEIGMVRFADLPTESAAGWTIGQDEADDLMLDRDTGEIRVIEVGANGHVLARCASNGAGLLAALAAAAPYLASSATESASSFDVVAAHRSCVSNAGGDIYSNYWATLLGME